MFVFGGMGQGKGVLEKHCAVTQLPQDPGALGGTVELFSP